MSGVNHNPFGQDNFPDADLETSKSMGLRPVLRVNPTGSAFNTGFKPYCLTVSSIQGVSVSKDTSVPLSPALYQGNQVIPVNDWIT